MSKFTYETGIYCTPSLEQLTYPSHDFLAATLSSESVQNFREDRPLCCSVCDWGKGGGQETSSSLGAGLPAARPVAGN